VLKEAILNWGGAGLLCKNILFSVIHSNKEKRKEGRQGRGGKRLFKKVLGS
jgi:hypothetical protein